jgi:hypothetical protein
MYLYSKEYSATHYTTVLIERLPANITLSQTFASRRRWSSWILRSMKSSDRRSSVHFILDLNYSAAIISRYWTATSPHNLPSHTSTNTKSFPIITQLPKILPPPPTTTNPHTFPSHRIWAWRYRFGPNMQSMLRKMLCWNLNWSTRNCTFFRFFVSHCASSETIQCSSL